MRASIENSPKQFLWNPTLETKGRVTLETNERLQLRKTDSLVVLGMGGSNLASGILKMRFPEMNVMVHRDYGLPQISRDVLEKSLIVANSYSGNTEEVIDGFHAALESGLHVAAVAIGGKVLDIAREKKAPFIQIPDTGIQPRLALGFQLKALLKLLGLENELKEVSKLAHVLNIGSAEKEGEKLAKSLQGAVPVIYSSAKNLPVAYNWKVKFNETGKIPAFYNAFPELNHNEMTGHDWVHKTKILSSRFHFIFLEDPEDDKRITKRMEVCKKLFEDRDFPVTSLSLRGNSIFEKVFSSLLIADWAAYHTALLYGAEPEQVPLVEEFKKLIAK